MKVAYLLQVLSAAACLCAAEDSGPGWQWSWACKSGRCVKSEYPISYASSRGISNITRKSQSACRLTCGQYGALWPHPTGPTTIGEQVVAFHPSIIRFDLLEVVDSGRGTREYLAACTQLFLDNLLVECGANCSVVSDTDVYVRLVTRSQDLTLNWNTDETYTLDIVTSSRVNSVTVNIRAETVYGARHGLETLSQLVARVPAPLGGGGRGHSSPRKHLLIMATNVRLSDAPIFRHRGLMLDTARNFLPLYAMKRTLDAMAASKLNVLHWHATDSQSFPLESPRVPQLARRRFGAYSSRQVYTPQDVAYLLEYARLRGVRIIMELDAPSHAGNGWQWGEAAGLGQLAVCVNQQPWRKYCIQPPCGQLNPTNPNLYRVLRDLYRDILDIFPRGEPLHMGGDEVYFPCWNSSAEIVNWMEARGQGRGQADFLQLWADYQSTALGTLDEEVGHSNTPIILWSSHLTEPGVIESFLNKDRYIIQTWVPASSSLPVELLAKGYRVIYSTKDTWYLDHGFWGSTVYHNWRVVYDNRIPRKAGVLGGEACMWSELVDNQSLDAKVWPRTAAMAERLWADPETRSSSAEARFYRHRQRLVTRGIRADAVSPAYCYQNEGECQ
ncbi:Chitooligosaccharidolytic beta-N-acetylglucosaminidase [Cryptotermes secundus]|uniref:beta-N-acetylhexosaminidase n=1 Tax=Cryptotermes secundus TaxID=105785 RepID=A0A2J7QLQ5_9NEOP|nr:chitooligosaccharidolytic beta-N-acetylglucosaminidase isoform X1 [Cryptotermes secundus]XP_023711754.1 chitooligosaccharidolytic beta-N-acetylglucosaminidase isoform X1 [Cryptotermes secundus]PNF29506.1 Chitooligosaccharidolytic beta-N-acetylglucosaminidase [Cryptotermes secundus]